MPQVKSISPLSSRGLHHRLGRVCVRGAGRGRTRRRHQPQPAHIADHREPLLQFAQAGHQLLAPLAAFSRRFSSWIALHGRRRGRAGHRVAAVGAAVRCRASTSGTIPAGEHARERHAGGDALGHGHDIGDDAEVLYGEPACPVRPKPDCISSATSSMPCRSHSSLSSRMNPAAGRRSRPRRAPARSRWQAVSSGAVWLFSRRSSSPRQKSVVASSSQP